MTGVIASGESLPVRTVCRSSIRASLLVAAVGAATAASQASALAASPASLIESVPSSPTQTRYDAKDSSGQNSLSGLDPIPDTDGSGYLGVYYTNSCAVQPPPGAECNAADQRNVVRLGESNDLLNWDSRAELDVSGANMPVIRNVGGEKFLVAYEDYGRGRDASFQSRLVVRYYTSRARLLSNTYSRQEVIPRTLSRFNEGTPNFESVSWTGSTFTAARSRITFNFHYNDTRRPSALRPDRQARGVLRGFESSSGGWDSATRPSIDRSLTNAGFPGKHGKRTRFTFDGGTWRVYEAQRNTNLGAFDSWSLVLFQTATGATQGLNITTPAGPLTSVGVPVVKVLPAPTGGGDVLFVSSTVFGGGGPAGTPGSLIYYNPIAPGLASAAEAPTGESSTEDVAPTPEDADSDAPLPEEARPVEGPAD